MPTFLFCTFSHCFFFLFHTLCGQPDNKHAASPFPTLMADIPDCRWLCFSLSPNMTPESFSKRCCNLSRHKGYIYGHSPKPNQRDTRWVYQAKKILGSEHQGNEQVKLTNLSVNYQLPVNLPLHLQALNNIAKVSLMNR